MNQNTQTPDQGEIISSDSIAKDIKVIRQWVVFFGWLTVILIVAPLCFYLGTLL